MSSLIVWVEGSRVGRLDVERGLWGFAYDPAWLSNDDSFPLTLSLPLREQPFRDDTEHRPVFWYFANLLPEGGIREALARHARLAADDNFGLLERFGGESAGALTLLPEDAPFELGHYEAITGEQLRGLLAELPRVPLLAAGKRMSLAGAQHKLGVHRADGELLLPRGNIASSWILKPDNADTASFPWCPANEHFCMSLAGRIGLAVPPVELLHLPEAIFLVRRFDREPGPPVRRLHQIDLCQLLDRWPEYKYQVSFTECYRALDSTRQPVVARYQILRWLVFNYLVGNSDAHAKNVSFLLSSRGIELAPFYDLLSVRAYGDEYDYLAMAIGEQTRFQWVETKDWHGLAEAIGLRASYLDKIRHEMAEQLPKEARALLDEASCYTAPELDLLEQVLETIVRIARHTLAS